MAAVHPLREIRELVLNDPALQERLFGITDKDEFTRFLSDLASKNGLALTQEDVDAGMREGRRAWIERWI